MDLHIQEEAPQDLEDYGRVSIAFTVDRVLESVQQGYNGLEGIALVEKRLETPYVKDIDAYDGSPERWRRRWDLSNWGILSGYIDGERVGGAVVAYNTDGVNTLEGRSDLAALWDFRVRPDLRGRGIGVRLFERAESWAAARGCRLFKVETQNNNVAACRFYAARGCHLGLINRYAYEELPQETELTWYKELNGV